MVAHICNPRTERVDAIRSLDTMGYQAYIHKRTLTQKKWWMSCEEWLLMLYTGLHEHTQTMHVQLYAHSDAHSMNIGKHILIIFLAHHKHLKWATWDFANFQLIQKSHDFSLRLHTSRELLKSVFLKPPALYCPLQLYIYHTYCSISVIRLLHSTRLRMHSSTSPYALAHVDHILLLMPSLS